MPKGHAVVDGSNIATEGRTEPSLKQLREAVAEFEAENDFKHVTVVVDASFEHRVAAREKRAARAAVDDGEIITPPAGVVGRGDAFILEVADRADAVVLSNDSFQEFHGTYPWLFDEGRLIGGKPVPGVGWVYVARTPVRGPVSRRATKKAARSTTKKTVKATKKTAAPAKKAGAKRTSDPGPPAASAEGTDPDRNTVATLRAFRRDHPVGSTVRATVERYSSHGAYGHAGDAVVYFPNRLLGEPPPNRARDTVTIGETRDFLVHRYDDERRGIDLGLVPVPDAPEPPPTTTRTTAKKSAKKATATARSSKAGSKKAASSKAGSKRTTKKSTKKASTSKAPTKKASTKKASTAKASNSRASTSKDGSAKKRAKKASSKTSSSKASAKKTTRSSGAKKAAESTAKRAPRGRTFDNTK